jgi:hypothetical protein
MDEDFLKKMDPVGRLRLREGGLDGPIEVLVRTNARAKGAPTQALKDAGLEIHTVVGSVVVGRVANVNALKAVARLPQVNQIELSRPLARE